jgi:hypothetical protein
LSTKPANSFAHTFKSATVSRGDASIQIMSVPNLKQLCSSIGIVLFAASIGTLTGVAQDAPFPDAPQPQSEAHSTDGQQKPRLKPSPNHIFWIIPNYRADENSGPFQPLRPGQKFRMGFDDSFDPSAFLVAGVFAGIAEAQNQYRDFGDGAPALGKYYAAAFADQAIGNMMTEAIFPVALHQDPRYFVKNRGGIWRRMGYAISREVVTRGDDGANHFNTSEVAGNAVAAGISTLYYPASDRTFGNVANKWGEQIGLDAFFNVMKEFWPDVRDRLFGP